MIVLYDNELIPFMDELYKKYAESSRGRIGSKDRATDLVALYGKPPLFNDGWLLECSEGVKASSLKKLESAFNGNKIVIRVKSMEKLEEKSKEFQEFEAMVIDNHSLKESEVIDWIIKELACGYSVASALYKRTNGRLSDVQAGVRTLSLLDTVAVTDVRRFIEKRRKVFVRDVVEWILGVPRRGIKFDDVAGLIYNFRYAQSWLLGSIDDELEKYQTVFTYAATGELTLKNYSSFKESCSDKVIQKIPEYQLKMMLKNFGLVSLEYVYFIRATVAGIPKHNKLGVFKLMQILKLGGK